MSDKPGKQIVKGNEAGENIVLGNLTQNFQISNTGASDGVKLLVAALEHEIEEDITRSGWIEDLQSFEEPYVVDEYRGLEEKLKVAGLSGKRIYALHQKEKFAKFLERYALYNSAQALISLCLHKVFTDFEAYVHPQCGSVTNDELHKIIHEIVVAGVLKEYSLGAFALNHSLVWGMTYWLADRCYVRWHEIAEHA